MIDGDGNGYDPEYWDDLVMQAMMRHWENPPSIEKGAQEMDAETAPIYAAWREAAHKAFPWAEVWYGETDRDQFVGELRERMSERTRSRSRTVETTTRGGLSLNGLTAIARRRGTLRVDHARPSRGWQDGVPGSRRTTWRYRLGLKKREPKRSVVLPARAGPVVPYGGRVTWVIRVRGR